MARLEAYVKPGSKHPGAALRGNALELRVRERAVDGAANAAAILAIAELFGVPPSRVALLRGATGRRKLFEIEAMSAEAIAAKMQALAGSANPGAA